MATARITSRFVLGSCMVLIGCLPALAQPSSVDGFRNQLEAILNDKDLDRLEQVRKLRILAEREEAALLQSEVTKWVEQLGGAEFALREAAQKKLIEAGESSIAAVAQSATSTDRERAERSLMILTAIAKSDDVETAASAQQALLGLAALKTPIGERATNIVVKLNETDQDRAIAALVAVGARIRKNNDGEVTSVYASTRRGFSDREMKLLSVFPRIQSLTVSGGDVTDAGLAGLSELKNLRSLSLLRTSITDDGLAKIASLPKVQYLSIGSEKITHEGLRKLKDAQSLRSLSLFGVRLTEADVDVLLSLDLPRLSLSIRDVTDADLRAIGKLANLTFLAIKDKRITDAGMEHLVNLHSLRRLSLKGTSVTAEGAAKLRVALPKLMKVDR